MISDYEGPEDGEFPEDVDVWEEQEDNDLWDGEEDFWEDEEDLE